MIFVTDMDIDNASYRQVVEDLQALYGKKNCTVSSAGGRMASLSDMSMSSSRKQSDNR